jgi:hypothetical protein
VNINIPSTNIIDFAVVIISLLFSISIDVVVVVEAVVAVVGEEGTDDEVLILDGEDGADDAEDGLTLLCVL